MVRQSLQLTWSRIRVPKIDDYLNSTKELLGSKEFTDSELLPDKRIFVERRLTSGFYKGEMLGNDADGKGTMDYDNGDTFSGVFIKGFPGSGKFVWKWQVY